MDIVWSESASHKTTNIVGFHFCGVFRDARQDGGRQGLEERGE